jgi:hypothetical protein
VQPAGEKNVEVGSSAKQHKCWRNGITWCGMRYVWHMMAAALLIWTMISKTSNDCMIDLPMNLRRHHDDHDQVDLADPLRQAVT